ncbi:hypothetical protein H4S07_004326 [Coemansia furcata]|uniref:Uncharacterized protein n=1 Tax=Coemansia furcata TaxID=417177 RepID=A0ACC1L9C1_9FUNG|nr:hypothetical protein H4S07_004326 [Coemansia furcata]
MAKVRQGFQERRKQPLSESEIAILYRQGWNTLGFLKLARELGSIEREVVNTILRVHRERSAAEEKPGTKRRRLQPLQMQTYDLSYNSYDETIANIARDLDIVLPQDTLTRSLDWIPRLKRLHRGDPALESTDPIVDGV